MIVSRHDREGHFLTQEDEWINALIRYRSKGFL